MSSESIAEYPPRSFLSLRTSFNLSIIWVSRGSVLRIPFVSRALNRKHYNRLCPESTFGCKDSSHPEKLANTDDFLILAASSGGCTAAPSAIGDDFFVHVEQNVQVLVRRIDEVLAARRRLICQTATMPPQTFIWRKKTKSPHFHSAYFPINLGKRKKSGDWSLWLGALLAHGWIAHINGSFYLKMMMKQNIVVSKF